MLDHLVDWVHRWPGVNGLAALLDGRVMRARRPLHFLRAEGDMPNEVELSLAIPPELGPAAKVIEKRRDRVHRLRTSTPRNDSVPAAG